MTMNVRVMKTGVGLFLALLAAQGVFGLPTPEPIVKDGVFAEEEAVRSAIANGEFSFACDMKFGGLPSKGEVCGLFRLSADKQGFLTVTVPAAPTELEGDCSFRGTISVKAGEFHHVAFSYSLIRQRIAFYVDGRLAFENENIYLPVPEPGEATFGRGFGGELRNLRIWDVALESDRFLPAESGNRNLTRWDVRAAREKEAWQSRLDREVGQGGAADCGPVVLFTTDPTSQERVMPDRVPEEADFSGKVDVVLARDEFEDASVVAFARRGVKSFTLELSDLKSAGGAVIPAKDVDIRVVKRWYRTGGAWFSYFADFRHRVLTPHLLVHDDDLIQTDEIRQRNFYRLDYPTGRVYVDVSNPRKGIEPWRPDLPFRDADTLQPVKTLDAPGRDLQYFLTFHAAKDTPPGLYRGTLAAIADGARTGALEVRVRVLPFVLPPRGGAYEDPSRDYISHCNIQGTIIQGTTYAENRASAFAELKSLKDHNTLDVTQIWDDPQRTKMSRELGFPEEKVFTKLWLEPWQRFWPGTATEALTEAQRQLGLRVSRRQWQTKIDYFRSNFPKSRPQVLFNSEASSFERLSVQQRDQAEIARALGCDVFAHGMGDYYWYFGAEHQDWHVQSGVNRRLADQWHAVGGSVIAYAKPFASPENPAIHRRMLGFGRYKGARMDGNMQHGVMGGAASVNQFAPNPAGDGNYRCQIMLYQQRGGFLETICWAGVREAYDDIRYATLLKRMATPLLQDGDETIRREARRALVWLENQDGDTASLKSVRFGIIDRILTLRRLLKAAGREVLR